MPLRQLFSRIRYFSQETKYRFSCIDFNAIKQKTNSIVLSSSIAIMPATIEFSGKALSGEASDWGLAFVETIASQTGLLMLGVGLVISTMNEDIAGYRSWRRGSSHDPVMSKLSIAYILFCTMLFTILTPQVKAISASWHCAIATMLVSLFLAGLSLSVYRRITRNLA